MPAASGELRPELIALLIDYRRAAFAGPDSNPLVDWCARLEPDLRLSAMRLFGRARARADHVSRYQERPTSRGGSAPWAAAIMAEYLAWRGHLEDREGPLFLTDQRQPYTDNGKAAGGQTKTAFKGMVRRTIATVRRQGLAEAARLRRAGQGAAARDHWRAVRDGDIAFLEQLTPHWFRHLLATNLLATGDLTSTMEQGGWRDARSVQRYAHDVPAQRRQLAAPAATFWPGEPATAEKK